MERQRSGGSKLSTFFFALQKLYEGGLYGKAFSHVSAFVHFCAYAQVILT